MDKKQLKQEIDRLKPWYQNVDFGNDIKAVSQHSTLSGEYAWNYIKQLLPDNLDGKRILDLGANAGLFCIRTAQMGSKEVVGIDNRGRYVRQCELLKKHFNTPNVTYIKDNLENLPNIDLGKFDIILAIAVLYWVGRGGGGKVSKGTHYSKAYRDKELKFIDHLVTLSDKFIVRARGQQYNNSEYYGNIFDSHGFDMKQLINEDTGRHEIMLFERR